jgi:hypothetical protein
MPADAPRRLKRIEDIDFDNMRITVVNETPGSVREIDKSQLRGEMLRMMHKDPETGRLPWENGNENR